MDQITDATYQIKQSVKTVQPSVLLPPQVPDSYKFEFPTSDGLGSLDPAHQESMLLSTELDHPDLSSLLKELSEETRTRIHEAVQHTHYKKLAKVKSWHSDMEANFKTYCQGSAKFSIG